MGMDCRVIVADDDELRLLHWSLPNRVYTRRLIVERDKPFELIFQKIIQVLVWIAGNDMQMAEDMWRVFENEHTQVVLAAE